MGMYTLNEDRYDGMSEECGDVIKSAWGGDVVWCGVV